MEKLQRIIDLFRKGLPIITGAIEVGRNEDAQEAAKALMLPDDPTDAELDKSDATLDRLLDKFNEPMKPRPAQ